MWKVRDAKETGNAYYDKTEDRKSGRGSTGIAGKSTSESIAGLGGSAAESVEVWQDVDSSTAGGSMT